MGFGDNDTHPKYQGQVKDGKPNGLGILIYPDGRKYVGNWRDGERNGQGTYTYPNGKKYGGSLKDGFSWNGKLYDKNGKIIKTWVNGIMFYGDY